MNSDGKEKAQGVAVVDLLRPAGLFYFSMLVAKITRFTQSRWENKAPYNTHL